MANQKRDVKLTLTDLVAKKAEKEAARTRSEDVYVESLGGYLTVQSPPRNIFFKSIDMSGDTTESQVYANMFLIYNSVSLFRNSELLAEYDVTDNVEIVEKLLEFHEIKDLAEKAMELSGFMKPQKLDEEIKN